jgi:hypothetical protein
MQTEEATGTVNECNGPVLAKGRVERVQFRLAGMLIVKRLIVWLLERLIEALFLGGLLGFLLHLSLRPFWVYALAVGIVLFMHGYYLTTAFFALVWRNTKWWFYPAITAALFVAHAHFAFLRGKHDLSPEARAIELPFLVGGACLASACSFAGERVLSKWLRNGADTNPYVSATVVTLFLFAFANTAHFMRVTYSNGFRPDGIPFSFYREGGFSDGYVWHSGTFLWHGVIADAVLLAGIAGLLAKAWQSFAAARAR